MTPLADFLAGYAYQSSIVLGDPVRKVYVNNYNLLLQDNWRVSRSLTLDYGLRYDYATPLHKDRSDLSTFIPSRGGLVLAGQGIDTVYPSDKKNFSPRLGPFQFVVVGQQGEWAGRVKAIPKLGPLRTCRRS